MGRRIAALVVALTVAAPATAGAAGFYLHTTTDPAYFQNGEVVHQFMDVSSYAEQLLVHEHAVAVELQCQAVRGIGFRIDLFPLLFKTFSTLVFNSSAFTGFVI